MCYNNSLHPYRDSNISAAITIPRPVEEEQDNIIWHNFWEVLQRGLSLDELCSERPTRQKSVQAVIETAQNWGRGPPCESNSSLLLLQPMEGGASWHVLSRWNRSWNQAFSISFWSLTMGKTAKITPQGKRRFSLFSLFLISFYCQTEVGSLLCIRCVSE